MAGSALGGSIWNDSAWVAAFEQNYAAAAAAAVAAGGGSSAVGGSASSAADGGATGAAAGAGSASATGVAASERAAGSISGGVNVAGMGINSGGAAGGGLSLLNLDSALVTGLTTKEKVSTMLHIQYNTEGARLMHGYFLNVVGPTVPKSHDEINLALIQYKAAAWTSVACWLWRVES